MTKIRNGNCEIGTNSCGVVIETIPKEEPVLFPLQVIIYSLRDYLRPLFASRIKSGIEETLPLFQKWRSPLLDIVFSIASFCGSEDFYVICFPIVYWEYSEKLALLLLTLFAINVYISNCFKNMFRLPRPPPTKSDKKMILDSNGYGFPSMHSMNAVGLPFLFLLYRNNYVLPWKSHDSFVQIQFLVALIWLTWIVGSRLYLAVHSPLDVQAGLILGFLTLSGFVVVGESMVDWVVETHGPFLVYSVLTTVILLLILLHPFPFNKTLAETSGLLGTIYGFLVGRRIGPLILPTTVRLTTCSVFQEMGGPVLRSVLGMVAVLLIIEVSKKFVKQLIAKVFGTEFEMVGLVISKFLSYVIVTVSLTVLIPLFWRLVGILPFCQHNHSVMQFL